MLTNIYIRSKLFHMNLPTIFLLHNSQNHIHPSVEDNQRLNPKLWVFGVIQ